MALELYLEVGSRDHQAASVLGWLLNYPGCVAYGQTQQEVIEKAPTVARAYLEWLRAHGETQWTPIEIEPQPSEVFQVAFISDYEINAIFSPDFGAVPTSHLQKCLRWLQWAHDDLLLVAARLHPEMLDRKPDAGSMSIREIVRHVARAQFWYLSRLEANPPPLPPAKPQDDVFETLKAAHEETVSQLSKLSDESGKQILTHEGEVWTVRKVLRRSLYHAAYHRHQIERWLRQMVPISS